MKKAMTKAEVKKAMRVTYEFVIMDKTLADKLLAKNKGNRTFKPKKIITLTKIPAQSGDFFVHFFG